MNPATNPQAAYQALVTTMRETLDSVMHTAVGHAELAVIAGQLQDITRTLLGRTRPDPWFWSREPPAAVTGTMADPAPAANGWASCNPVAPPLLLEMDDQTIVGTVTLGAAYAGPPGLVHGGTVAALIDHAMGIYLACVGRASMTANLSVDFLAGTPLFRPLTVRAGTREVSGRKTTVWASVQADDVVTARATGLFVMVRR
ncbi:PaaI family thioesterase [Acrocarpospora catenulata]|uniref:PaaI family thioesterase n=1 Tax=Acrocarpospora catenulata TaxID=2836182 RepID=UPI001BDAC60F|nr:PaaI family thioesterase [Acrocarpospora catenulata]